MPQERRAVCAASRGGCSFPTRLHTGLGESPAVICDPSKLDDAGCHGAPDWVIEIVSPGSRARDHMTKLFKYRTAGVREYWIVDPENRW